MIHGDDWQHNYLSKIREEVFAVMAEWQGQVVEIPYTQGINSTSLVENAAGIGTGCTTCQSTAFASSKKGCSDNGGSFWIERPYHRTLGSGKK